MQKDTALPYAGKEHGVVRLRVVISKKQLTELMSSREASQQDQGGKIEMEKMLARILSTEKVIPKLQLSKAASFSVTNDSWKPSLDGIPENRPSP
ncbi:hypothetical protein KP509_13G030200 [Ceratopteris richardii]|nr:hypothetical protein KP509_13G030200 [Ceratopteris richardii]